MQPSMKVEVRAYQVIEKVVKASGSSGRVYVPPEWIGKRVKILLMDPLEEGNKLSRNLNQDHPKGRMDEGIKS